MTASPIPIRARINALMPIGSSQLVLLLPDVESVLSVGWAVVELGLLSLGVFGKVGPVTAVPIGVAVSRYLIGLSSVVASVFVSRWWLRALICT